ncbi:MAG TPA: GMC family oxidoreductase [Polyangiaceae bacterium]|jgi:glycine/D-amino acid oxidase-like deaminating enzyme
MSETQAHTNGAAAQRRLPISHGERPRKEGARFTDTERRIAVALAEALLPGGGKFLPRAGDDTVTRLEEMLLHFGAQAPRHYGALLRALEQGVRPFSRGRAFTELHEYERTRLLGEWSDASDPARRAFILGLTAPMKVAYFDDETIYRALGASFRFQAAPERPRFMERVTRDSDITEDIEVECDAVVVGTGAGGAVVAKELAQKGFAVLMLEEGQFHQRSEFTGGLVESVTRFYRERGTVGSVGNTVVILPMGRMVGGSTAINTGTCWRTPEWILNKWVEREGLRELAPDAMAPYFDKVWNELGITRADWKYLGGAARVVARGCDALGYSHRPVDRNAPDCDGSGICDAGCPTDARRSTNVSYVPAALRAGAELYTGVRAESLVREGDRIVGVVGKTARGKKVTVRARASILACGTLVTPLLLQRERIHRVLPQVGKNLSVHPATIVSALFDEEIKGYSAIPQGYCVDQLQREHGILMLGASAPIEVGASQFTFVGDTLVRTMERYDRIASMGIMVSDDSRGSVRRGPGGRPLIFYWVGKKERARLTKGIGAMSRIFLAAGAREVYPSVHGHRVLGGARDLAKLESAKLGAGDFTLMGFHPLGTCRMATSAARGVVDTDYQVFGHAGLFVVDGSVVPSSVAVNPQVTIMALSTRAADRIAQKLS